MKEKLKLLNKNNQLKKTKIMDNGTLYLSDFAISFLGRSNVMENFKDPERIQLDWINSKTIKNLFSFWMNIYSCQNHKSILKLKYIT